VPTSSHLIRFTRLFCLAGLTLAAGPVWAQRSVALPPVSPGEFQGDVRSLRTVAPKAPNIQRIVRDELEPPPNRKPPRTGQATGQAATTEQRAPMPATIQNFAGINNVETGLFYPSDANGDVGPNHFIEGVNDSYAIYTKTGTRLALFTQDALWQGIGSSQCNGNSQGDPVVLYDRLTDHWYLTHFAFGSDSQGNDVAPFYECIAVSKNGDPVNGGYWLYAIRMDPGGAGLPPVGTLADYPKFGLWPDGCLYMAANEYFEPSREFAGTVAASFNRGDMVAGAQLRMSLIYLPAANSPFTMLPSNILGTSLPAAGTPNYFVSESQTDYAFEVRKFTPGANCGAGGTLGAPINVSQASYTVPSPIIIPQPNTNGRLDSLQDRMMQKVQYRKIGNTESLWVVHSVLANNTSPVMQQWAQINVTGGAIATTPVQQQIYGPDQLHRWIGSLAVDQAGNMALGYSTANGAVPNFPSIAYAGRLATDPPGTLPQTETQVIAGTASQTHLISGEQTDRWGDYSSMSIDPTDDCTFWYVNQYYASQADGTSGNWSTRIASFKFPACGGTVVNTAPAPINLTPATGNGNQTLTVTFNAPGGVQTLDVVNVLINTALDGRQACYLAYSRPSNALYIVADNGDSNQISGKVMDGNGSVGNSQCMVTLAGTSATGNGNTLTLALNLSFSSSFAGNKVVYAAARDLSQRNSGWQTMGVRGVPPLPTAFPKPVGLNPPSGTTLNQTITFTYQDQSAATNLQTVWALINTAIDGRSACYVAYYRPGNQLFLYPDNGDGSQAGNIVLSGNNSISNSQCTVSAVGASVQTSGNTLTVILPITFKTAFAGFKIVWLAAQTLAGQASPWQALGAEVVPGQ
jgi:hypothetical protein